MSKLTRRKFLKISGISAISFGITASFLGFTGLMEKKRRFGRIHENQRKNAKLAELKKIICKLQYTIKKDKIKLDARGKAGKPCGYLDARLHANRIKMRHYHIAYCELRGKKRSQIECPNKDNIPSEDQIALIKERFS